jgi:hypothetical protein
MNLLAPMALILLNCALGCSNSSGDKPGATDVVPPAGSAGAGAVPTDSNPPGTATPPTTPGKDPVTTPTDPNTPPVAMGAESDPKTPFSALPAKCVGFTVLGLKFSPGGDVLPNTCAPFDSVLNNPHAVRCIDADPKYTTGYPGDNYCILPPDPSMGTQLHLAPADFANPGADFIMEPGEEVTDYYYMNAPNTEERFFYRINLRMRAGSHHMINRMLDADRADGWSLTGDNSFTAQSANSRSFPGAQRPNQDRPQGTLAVPPENDGLGERLLVKQQFSLNLHHFNFGDKPTLREVWINIWYKAQAEVTDEMGGVAVFGNPADVSIPAGEHRELHYKCTVPGNTRIITLNGHRHTWTDRFGVWVVKKDSGKSVPVYESFHYDDMPTYQYDSVSMNPVPELATKTDGGFTGMLDVVPGDELHFVCDINNTSGQRLRFANEVVTGEMCILFGTRTGAPLCGAGMRVQ